MKNRTYIQKLVLAMAYTLSLLIGLNFYISRKVDQGSNVYQSLYKIGYYKIKNDPYENAFKLKLHPTNYFSLPYNSNEKGMINNSTFSLDKNGYRVNPYIKNEEKRNCILFLGSSAAFGVGVSEDSNTMPSILNNKLGKRYNVFNLSVPSWNSRQELISYINFLNKDIKNNCTNIDTISYTGNTDLNGIIYSMKNKLYNNNDSRSELISTPENFNILYENVLFAKNSKDNLKSNLITLIDSMKNILFGEIGLIIKDYLRNNRDSNKRTEVLDTNKIDFIRKQIDSFFINQKIINNITFNLKGKHLIIIQPNISNNNSNTHIYKVSNEIISKKLSNNNCLEILDLRSELYDYILSNNYNQNSLKDSIKINKSVNPENYIFFDNSSHLTNKGSFLVSSKILNKYKTISNSKKCDI